MSVKYLTHFLTRIVAQNIFKCKIFLFRTNCNSSWYGSHPRCSPWARQEWKIIAWLLPSDRFSSTWSWVFISQSLPPLKHIGSHCLCVKSNFLHSDRSMGSHLFPSHLVFLTVAKRIKVQPDCVLHQLGRLYGDPRQHHDEDLSLQPHLPEPFPLAPAPIASSSVLPECTCHSAPGTDSPTSCGCHPLVLWHEHFHLECSVLLPVPASPQEAF